ncbi:MAG TPA: DUF5009 domain-containing protein [Cyclobacteriaceae bacterium]|nr:DUF5009 domain-containing protein [Cyclobacteriaceae bacterium]
MNEQTASVSAAGGNSNAGSGTLPLQRIATIDILRALTMILMIFVNDLWSLKNIPEWLGHVGRGVDGMGLADTVFPAFLFIVGLSIPFAIANRRKKGATQGQLLMHVLTRSFALLVMGVFLVNGETFNAAATGMPRYFYNPLCCLAFILIWNSYPATMNKKWIYALKAIAVVILVTLAITYRGGPEDNIHRFGPSWWGILGLIGWAYLASGIIIVLSKGNFWVILGGWVFFCALSMLWHAGIIPHQGFITVIPSAILGGTIAGFTIGGVLTSMIFKYFRDKNNNSGLTISFLAFAGLLVVLFYVTRPYWGLAKLGATPAWLYICSALTILAFIVIYWIADVWGKANAFNIIKPAGTDTLLCYLIPYFAYATMRMLGLHLPEAVLIGAIGLIKSLLFALLCAWITGSLNKVGVRLKL